MLLINQFTKSSELLLMFIILTSISLQSQPSLKTTALNNLSADTKFCESIDYDRDGDLDFVTVDVGTGNSREFFPSIVLLENTPTREFPKRKIVYINYINTITGFHIEDFNKDGLWDFLIAKRRLSKTQNDGGIIILFQQSNGEFIEKKVIDQDINLMDWDNDKKTDIVVLGQYRTGANFIEYKYKSSFLVLLNRGLEFEQSSLFEVDQRIMAMKTIDIDEDGDIDIAYTSYFGDLELALNNGKGNAFAFVQETTLPRYKDAFRFGKIHAADFDQDNHQELYWGFYDAGWLLRSVFSK